MDFKKPKIEPNKSAVAMAPLPYYDEAEINKKLAEHTKYLHEWEELINRNADPTVTAISQKDASRHIYLKKKLHDSLGIMARIVQHQMAMKKAGNLAGSEHKDSTNADTAEQQQREEVSKRHQEQLYHHQPSDPNKGLIEGNYPGSHDVPMNNYMYSGNPGNFNSSTTYQPYGNSQQTYASTVQFPHQAPSMMTVPPPYVGMYTSYPHPMSSQTSAPPHNVVGNEYMRPPTFNSLQPPPGVGLMNQNMQQNHAQQGMAYSQLNQGIVPNNQEIGSNQMSQGGLSTSRPI